MLSVPSLVMRSALLLPLSVARLTTGAGVEMSSVKVKDVVAWLPARSVARTCTALTPTTGAKLPLQLCPPSTLYSTTAPASTPVTLSVPTSVMPSLALAPLSVSSATRGAAVAVSSVKLKSVTARLPAASLTRTLTLLSPSTGVKLAAQVTPPSVL